MKQSFILAACIFFNFLCAQHCFYSQSGQDRYLNEQIFKNKTNGIFIDIGAHDGMTFSNTYFFETALGWKGICFEPMPNQFEKLKKNRNCICINACVAPTNDTVPFLWVHSEFPNLDMLSGMCQTYDPRHFARLHYELSLNGGSYEIVKIPAVCLNDVLHEHAIDRVDYLSIDTEGGELEILKSINFEKIHIAAISVENNYQDSTLRPFLESKGFIFVTAFDGFDELYVHNNEEKIYN